MGRFSEKNVIKCFNALLNVLNNKILEKLNQNQYLEIDVKTLKRTVLKIDTQYKF